MQETETATNVQDSNTHQLIEFVTALASRYELKALEPILQAYNSATRRADLTVAVLGRFKAGKSSFLNALIGKDLLPVGVVPVTSVITELFWGPEVNTEVTFLNGNTEPIPISRIAEFVSEAQNPENSKQVTRVCCQLPELISYKGIRLIDTPGLESVFSHNTRVSLAWAPNLDTALIAVGVDPPLSQQDIDLIGKVLEYTPKVYVLLTKVDLLAEQERQEVSLFIQQQLTSRFNQTIEILPYSTRRGFEHLRSSLEKLLTTVAANVVEQRSQVLTHKLRSLIREAGDYLRIALQSSQMHETERQRIRDRMLRDKQQVLDTKLELQLIARHFIENARGRIEQVLLPEQSPIEIELTKLLEHEYASWNMSFARLQDHFGEWLSTQLLRRLSEVSDSRQPKFLEALAKVQRQYLEVIQSFRDRLSQHALELFGIPLRTSETEIRLTPPRTPDIKIGRMFDHNWELLSPILPMAFLRWSIEKRFLRRVREETAKNFSRVVTQWTDIVTAAMLDMQREGNRRLDELLDTVERLTRTPSDNLTLLELDLNRLKQADHELVTAVTQPH